MDKAGLESACKLELEARSAEKASFLNQKAALQTELAALRVSYSPLVPHLYTVKFH